MQILLNRLPLLISCTLLGLLLLTCYLQLAPLISELLTDTPAAASQAQQAPAKLTPKKPFLIDKYHLFGKPGQVKKAPVVEAKNLPSTRLKLTLTGILAGSDKQQASALIEGPDRKTEYYKVGDKIPGNASLNAIYPDRVVLSRSGRLENLLFPEVSTGGGNLLAIQEAQNQDAENNTESAPELPTYGGKQISNKRKQSIKDRLSTLRNRIANDRK